MRQENPDPIGAAWLLDRYGLSLVMPLATVSRIGKRRTLRETSDGTTIETYPVAMRPDASLRGHLTFHLKHETPHLEMLTRLFAVSGPQEFVDWLASEPTGQYARRAGFLYEFLIGQKLPCDAAKAGSYVDALPTEKLVTATAEHAPLNHRWRIRDNLPGTRHFCPMIRKTSSVQEAMRLDVPELLRGLMTEFGDDLLIRSAVWLTLRENKSSFAIEGETERPDRIARFVNVLASRTGKDDWPLDEASLAGLQAEILGERTSLRQFGLRQSPVFIGETARYQEIMHYIAPPAEEVTPMLEGLRVFLERTTGQSPVMRAAVVSFGFVYIHPLADGNGRVHRFLINDSLRRDGAIQPPMILPVSARITDHPAERAAYDRTLDAVSRPLMRQLAGLHEFSAIATQYPDGIHSNLLFRGEALARPVWRNPDLSAHVVWLAQTLEHAIREDMREESRYLRNHLRARTAIKDIIEMPDAQIDRVIRSCQNNRGELSNTLAKEIPALQETDLWQAIRQAVEHAFTG
jgi:hypothetical protein